MPSDKYFMDLAFAIANASKCVRAKYGTVIVSHDGRIVSTGYNGKPRGSTNDHLCYRNNLPANSPKPKCCLHSEANALLFAGAERTQGATLYVSGVPCTDCALLIQQAGISRLVYYSGENAFGHRGNFDTEFYRAYGMTFEVVPYD
ncbi:MAG TPA: deaminase [Bellilinea sp.]|nr:deaminase [Bellilinea sp.]